jgi:hypothetical protein
VGIPWASSASCLNGSSPKYGEPFANETMPVRFRAVWKICLTSGDGPDDTRSATVRGGQDVVKGEGGMLRPPFHVD